MHRQISILLISLVAAAGTARGQDAAQTPTPAPAPAKASPLIEFSDKVVRLESAGVSMKLPLGCNATTNTAVDASSLQVRPEDSTWLLQIESPRTSRGDITLKAVCDVMIDQLLATSARVVDKSVEKRDRDFEFGKVLQAVRGKLVERQDSLTLTGWPPAARFYVETYPDNTTGSDSRLGVIRGFTVVQISADRFVTFEFRTPKPNFADARVVYETMVATSTFADPATVQTGRKGALEGGLQIMQRVDDVALKKIVEALPERWQRLYIPSKSGAAGDDTEIGYRRLRFHWGKRGEIDSSRKENQWTSVEKQEGIVILLDARALDVDMLSPTKKVRRVIDSASAFFMTPDRAQEAWLIRNAIRDGKTTSQITEIGSRNGTDMVVSVSANGQTQQVRPIIQGELSSSGYMSQAEARLLPQILLLNKVSTEYGFYVWNSTSQTIKLRRDILDEPTPGVWKLTSRATEDSKPEISTFNEKGDFIRTELLNDSGDTMYWEPTDLQRLLDLWKQKGLPID